jgi:hypothetical protein
VKDGEIRMACKHYKDGQCLIIKKKCHLPDENGCSDGFGKGIIRYLKAIGTYEKVEQDTSYCNDISDT